MTGSGATWGGGRGDGEEGDGMGRRERGWGGGRGNGEEGEGVGRRERGMGRRQREDFVKRFPNMTHGVLSSPAHDTIPYYSQPWVTLGFVGPSQVDRLLTI